MAKKAKKSAVKKTSSKKKSTTRTKTASKVGKKKAAKVAVANKTKAKLSTSYAPSIGTGGSQRVSEYKLFTEDSVRNLEDQVNYFIRKGWHPVGGVVFSGQTYTQTMIRHEQ